MEEIWKDVMVDKEEKNKYRGLYQVSNLGRVKSLRNNIILSPKVVNRYKQVGLSKDNKVTHYKIHRLVLLAFNYEGYFLNAQVNHKDENPSNNRLDNLEWCDAKYNSNFGNHNKNISNSTKGRKLTEEQRIEMSKRMKGKYQGDKNPNYGTHINGKKVICLENKIVYESCRDAEKN